MTKANMKAILNLEKMLKKWGFESIHIDSDGTHSIIEYPDEKGNVHAHTWTRLHK